MEEFEKTIYVVEYVNGDVDLYHEEQPTPAWPFVCKFEAEEKIKELQEEIEGEIDLRQGAETVIRKHNETIEYLYSQIKQKNEALKEAEKMAIAIEKCSLEPDKVYIHAGHIKYVAKQALQNKE